MTTVWFLIALIAFPGISAINYKGYYAYFTKEECETQRIPLENFIADVEIKRDRNTFYIETYCLKMEAFQDQLDNYQREKQRGIGLGGQQLDA